MPRGLLLEGTGHLSCGDIFSPSQGTLEFWFKPSSDKNNEWVLSIPKDPGNEMVIGFGPTAFLYMVKANGEWAYVYCSKTELAKGRWHHVACVFSSANAVLYVDGVAHRQHRPGNFSLDHLKGGELLIGKGPRQEYGRGVVSEVRLSRSLRYQTDFTPKVIPHEPDTDTVALWHCSEGAGAVLRDFSGNDHHGTVTGVVPRVDDSPYLNAAAGSLPCVRLEQGPAIDGVLDDPCWQEAAAAAEFVELGSSGYGLAPKQTTVKVAYDQNALYIGANCYEPDMDSILANVKTRDGAVFDDDCLEISLDTDSDRATFVHYGFNALGVYTDGVSDCTARLKFDRDWNSDLEVAATRRDDRWILEVAIPFKELGLPPPEAGSIWGFNAAREHRNGGQVLYSTWSALPGGSFHNPGHFGHLRFADASVPAGLRRISNLRPAIRNPAFTERDTAGQLTAWQLGPSTEVRETAYLSGVYVLHTASDRLMARQDTNLCHVAGRTYKVTVCAAATEGAQLGLVFRYQTEDGREEELWALRDQPLTLGYRDYARGVTIPAEARRIVAVELCRSSREGSLSCKSVSMSGGAARFDGVKEAADLFPEHRHPVGDPARSPCPRWATPLYGGPLRVLCVTGPHGRREVIELAQRLAMEADICWIGDGEMYAYGAEQINERIRREKDPYDVVLLTAPVRDPSFAEALRTNVEAGTGLVYVRLAQRKSPGPGLRELLPQEQGAGSDPHELAQAVPWSYLPVLSGPAHAGGVNVGSCGKGRVVQLAYAATERMGAVLPVMDEGLTDLPHWWEFVYSLLAKCVLHASSRPAPAAIQTVGMDMERGVMHIGVASRQEFPGRLTIRWEDKFGAADGHEEHYTLSATAEEQVVLEAAVPDAVSRSQALHVATLRLADAEGNVVDWRSVALPIHGNVRIAEDHPFERDWYAAGPAVQGRVRVRNAGIEPLRIRVLAELFDSHQRLVWSQSRPLSLAGDAEATVELAPAQERCLTVYHSLVVTVSDSGGILDKRAWDLLLTDYAKRAWDDVLFGGSAGYFRRSPTDAVIVRWLKENGIGFASEGSVFDSAPRLNLPWHKFFIAWKPFHHYTGRPVREPCLSDPAALATIAAAATTEAKRSREHAPLFYTIGDEIELSRDGRAEVCFSAHCSARFRRWAEHVYGSLDRANLEWGTQYGAWSEVMPISAEEARKRGNRAQWVDFRVFMEDVWNHAFVTVRDAVKREIPDALISFSNPFVRNPFSGEDHYKTALAEDVHCKYMRPDLIKEFRSFNRSAPMHTFYGYLESVPFCRYFPWHFALNGGDILAWWSVLYRELPYDLFDNLCRHTQRSLAVLETSGDFLSGVGKLLQDVRPVPGQVAMLYSHVSMHVAWIEGDMPVGDAPWGEGRMAALPVSTPFGLHYQSTQRLKALLKETSLQPDMLAPAQIEAGALAQYRVLLLPCSMAMADSTLSRIAEFVQAGGSVVADLQTARYTEHGKPTPKRPAFETLFGLTRADAVPEPGLASLSFSEQSPDTATGFEADGTCLRERLTLTGATALARHADGTPAVTINRHGQGKSIYLNVLPGSGPASVKLMSNVLLLAGVTRDLKLTCGDDEAFGYECFRFVRGSAEYIGILRDMPPQPAGERRSWFGPAYRHATERPEDIIVHLPRTSHLYDVREPKYLGHRDTVTLTFAACQARVLALLPYRVKDLELRGIKAEYSPGENVVCKAVIEAETGEPTDHVFRVEVHNPDGQLVTCYTRNILAADGSAQYVIPLALNERTGAWAVTVTDVASKASATGKLYVAGD